MIGSVADWAKRHGITRQAAYKRLKVHGIPFVGDGRIDFDRADVIFSMSVNPLQQQRGKGVPSSVPVLESPTGPGAGTISPLALAQHQREMIRLERERLKLDTEKGLVVQVTQIQRALSEAISQSKDRLLSAGAELRDRLAECQDPIECQRLVDFAIHQSLSSLSQFTFKASKTA